MSSGALLIDNNSNPLQSFMSHLRLMASTLYVYTFEELAQYEQRLLHWEGQKHPFASSVQTCVLHWYQLPFLPFKVAAFSNIGNS